MATVTGLTALRMLAIEAASVVSGIISGDNLILTRQNGTTINAGNVRGPQGPQGIPGAITASPAGGALAGNYPNPSLADGVVTDVKVAGANVDGVVTKASMRTLGTGAQQAAAGNHSHSGLTDSGWLDFSPTGGNTPFTPAAGGVVRAQYRKIGKAVQIRIEKTSGSVIDLSSNQGNFTNINVMGAGSVPSAARPDQDVNGAARMQDVPTTLVLKPDGSIVWTGGYPRSYPTGSTMTADFFFFMP